MSNSILSGLADSKAKTATTEEEATTAVEGVTFQTVLDFQATSVALKNTENYEKKHNLKDGKPIEAADDKKPDTEKKPKGDNETEPAWAKALREKNEALEAKFAAMDGDKIVSSRKTQLSAAIGKAPKEIKDQYEKDLSRMNFKDDEDYTAWLTEVTTGVNAIVEAAAVKGVVFGRPVSGGGPKGDEKPSAEVAARIAQRQAETVAPAIIGLPKTV